jgi:hypothetical protein
MVHRLAGGWAAGKGGGGEDGGMTELATLSSVWMVEHTGRRALAADLTCGGGDGCGGARHRRRRCSVMRSVRRSWAAAEHAGRRPRLLQWWATTSTAGWRPRVVGMGAVVSLSSWVGWLSLWERLVFLKSMLKAYHIFIGCAERPQRIGSFHPPASWFPHPPPPPRRLPSPQCAPVAPPCRRLPERTSPEKRFPAARHIAAITLEQRRLRSVASPTYPCSNDGFCR